MNPISYSYSCTCTCTALVDRPTAIAPTRRSSSITRASRASCLRWNVIAARRGRALDRAARFDSENEHVHVHEYEYEHVITTRVSWAS
jgi:hypothetical protein